jgi:hypothetical protein
VLEDNILLRLVVVRIEVDHIVVARTGVDRIAVGRIAEDHRIAVAVVEGIRLLLPFSSVRALYLRPIVNRRAPFATSYPERLTPYLTAKSSRDWANESKWFSR